MPGISLINRHVALFASIVATSVLLLVASGFGALILRAESGKLQNIPPYPNARNVTTRTIKVTDIRTEVHSTTFQTTDSVGDIESFYKLALQERGWRLEDVADPFITGQDSVHFLSGDSTEQCILIYGVDIVINPLPNGQNEVEVQSWDICGTA
jgi:hypothetical protein